MNRILKYKDGAEPKVNAGDVTNAGLAAINAGMTISQLYPTYQDKKNRDEMFKQDKLSDSMNMANNPLMMSYKDTNSVFDNKQANRNIAASALQGATAGASAGSSLAAVTGGASVAVGAALGAIGGLIGGAKKKSFDENTFEKQHAYNLNYNKELTFAQKSKNTQINDINRAAAINAGNARNGAVIKKSSSATCAMKKGAKMKECGCGCATGKMYRRGGAIDLEKENVIVSGPSHEMANGLRPGDKGLPLVKNGKKIAEIEGLELILADTTMKELEPLSKRAAAGDKAAKKELAEKLKTALNEDTYDYTKMLIS